MSTIQYYNLLFPVLGVVTASAIFLHPAPVSANWLGDNTNTFIASLAQKLGLGQDKVESAINSIQSDRQAEVKKNYEDYLTQLVTDKKITDAQKQLLIAKHKEMLDQRQKLADEMQKNRTDLDNWAKQNNIDPQYLFGYGMGGHMRGFGMKGFGMRHW